MNIQISKALAILVISNAKHWSGNIYTRNCCCKLKFVEIAPKYGFLLTSEVGRRTRFSKTETQKDKYSP